MVRGDGLSSATIFAMSTVRLPGGALRAAFLLLLSGSVLSAQEKVSLTASDGQPLVGTLILPRGTPTGGVLFLPARGARRVGFDPLTMRLRNSGLALLTLDPRGHGDSVVDKDGKPIELGRGVPADAAKNPFALATADATAGLDLLVAKGAPKDRLAIVAAGVSCATALRLGAAAPDRPKAVVLLTPDAEDSGLDVTTGAKEFARRACLVMATPEDAPRGATALKAALAYEEAEFREVSGALARGTGMFGTVPGLEATLSQWIADQLAAPWPIDVPVSATIVIDGEPSAGEGAGAAIISIPFETAGKAATVRVTHGPRTLDLAFDVPERYLRLNEVVVFIDGSAAGPRTPDASCYRVSFSPKNPARKPVLVQKGGLKGFEDSDDKGVVALARTEDKTHWTAEVSLDLDRFCGGAAPRTIRLAFQANGQKSDQLRSWPAVESLATSPRAWARARLK